MEMLVVLLLVALLGTLTVQGLGFFLRTYDVASRTQRNATDADLRRHWFATSVGGIVPYGVRARRFAGDAEAFHAVTLSPLNGESGVPTDVRWSIGTTTRGQSVAYAEGEESPWTMLRVEDEELAFQYADHELAWHDRWPLGESALWTPRMIRLLANDRTVWIASLEAWPIPRVTDDQLR